MEEELARALDRVLILSGGDVQRASKALNERMATHRGESCTDSTISSPSVTDSSPERVSSPRTQIHSSPGKNPPPTVTTTPPFKQLAPPVDNLPQGSETTPPPVTIRRLSPPGLGASSLSEPTYIKSSASPFVEVPSKSNHEISSPKSRSNGLPQPFVTPTNRDPPTPPDQVRIRNVFKPGTRTNPLDPLDTLHPILASIEPEYSSFYPSELLELKHKIAADPFYVGEPCHILLRNSTRGGAKHRVQTPDPRITSKGKWYTVTCGTEVGIFRDWLIVAPLVNGQSSAVHKSFTTKAEAFLCFQEALLKGTVELIN